MLIYPLIARATTSKEIDSIELAEKPITYESMILDAFPGAPIMLQIAYCESGNGCKAPLNPSAKNPRSSATGLFQIITSTWLAYECGPLESRIEASANIACARKIYNKEGTRPWRSSGEW